MLDTRLLTASGLDANDADNTFASQYLDTIKDVPVLLPGLNRKDAATILLLYPGGRFIGADIGRCRGILFGMGWPGKCGPLLVAGRGMLREQAGCEYCQAK